MPEIDLALVNYIEGRMKTVIEASQNAIASERRERIAASTIQGERTGKIEDQITALCNDDIKPIQKQLATILARLPDGWRGRAKMQGPPFLIGGTIVGVAELLAHWFGGS